MKKVVYVCLLISCLLGLFSLPASATGQWLSEDSALISNADYWTYRLDLVQIGKIPYVAAMGYDAGQPILFVSYFDTPSKTWKQLGETLNTSGATRLYTPQIAVGKMGPVVAFIEDNADGEPHLIVKYWSGASWATLPNVDSFDQHPRTTGLGILVEGDTVYIACCYTKEHKGAPTLWVKKNNLKSPTSWQVVGSYLNINPTCNTSIAQICRGADGNIYVSFGEEDTSNVTQAYVKCFKGGAWTLVSSGSLNVSSTSISSDIHMAATPIDCTTNRAIFVSWTESDIVYCKKYDISTGTWSSPAGGVVAASNSYNNDIATNLNGVPYILYATMTCGLQYMYVVVLSEDKWIPLGGPVGGSGSSAFGAGALNIDTNVIQTIRVAYYEETSSGYAAYEKIWWDK
jgi:hypothetical protein